MMMMICYRPVARGKLENTRTVSLHVVEGDRMDHLGKATGNHPIHVYSLRHHVEGSRLIYVPELISHGGRESGAWTHKLASL